MGSDGRLRSERARREAHRHAQTFVEAAGVLLKAETASTLVEARALLRHAIEAINNLLPVQRMGDDR